jgi:hypothetical protein
VNNLTASQLKHDKGKMEELCPIPLPPGFELQTYNTASLRTTNSVTLTLKSLI